MSESWETIEDIAQAFAAAGIEITRSALQRRLERRRDEKLIHAEWVHESGLRGSETRYPIGTAALAVEIERLLAFYKRNFAAVGWELWWQGTPVGDKHGLRRLRVIARYGDQLLRRIKREKTKLESSDANSTVFEQIAIPQSGPWSLKKVQRRVGPENMPGLLGIFVGALLGDFNPNLDQQDKTNIENALDIEQAKKDQVLDKKMNQAEVIPEFLATISSISGLTLGEICNLPKAELEAARDDARNGLAIATGMRAILTPIFGAGAFGLRQAGRLGEKATQIEQAILVLGFAALRRESHFLMPSSKISELKAAAEGLRDMGSKIRALQNQPEFSITLSNKNLKHGWGNADAQWQLLKEIEAAKIDRDHKIAPSKADEPEA